MVAGDITYVHNTLSNTGLGATTFQVPNGALIIGTSDGTNMPPTADAPDGTQGALVQTGLGQALTIIGGRWVNIQFNAGTGSSNANLNIGVANNVTTELENCICKLNNTGNGSRMSFGPSTSGSLAARVILRKNQLLFSQGNQGIVFRGVIEDWGSQYAPTGTIPSPMVIASSITARVRFSGIDFSNLTGTLFSKSTGADFIYYLDRCRMNAGVTLQAALDAPNEGEIYLIDSNSGDNHYIFAHYTWEGKTEATTTYSTKFSDKATYDDVNGYAWVVTGVNASLANPYYSPRISKVLKAASVGVAITPYLEAARDGSATKFNNDDVYPIFLVKDNSGFTNASMKSGRRPLLGASSAISTGSGTSQWNGLSGTAASMKLDGAGSITPQEIGELSCFLAVASNISIIVEPLIRS